MVGWVPDTNWRHPEEPASDLKGRDNYPVVHVAYGDAAAYAAWAGKDLPTEAQWEFAARGGRSGEFYAWGNKLSPGGKQMANIWEGEFPYKNSGADSFAGIAPVASFPANGYGLYDVAGNVWEWCKDWYAPTPMRRLRRKVSREIRPARRSPKVSIPANPVSPNACNAGAFLHRSSNEGVARGCHCVCY